ncbi:MAG: sugar phosphate isomerase/epimerase [Defluviitaleaceae bacterium]|nr:sugar phosphate isomerase/epimerase [Defluviitaleaceae bacterium]MCL2835919.1 sugar phosphate isomerase/epimerase [Defluviitaleaceae bacterium]
MKIGVRGHDIINGKTNPENLVGALKSAGMDTVQLVCHKSIEGTEYVPGSQNAEKAAFIGRAFGNNMHIALLGAYFNPVHPNKEIVETGIAVFRDNIEYAKTIGSDVVASETGSYQGDPWVYHPKNRTPEALNAVIDIFCGLAAYASKHSVCVGIEGAAGHVCHDIRALKHVVDSIGTDNIRVVFDYFNFMDGEHTDYIKILNEGLSVFPKIHCFHIKDCVLDGSLNQVPVGQGDMDFKKILSLIKQYDKDAVLILEGTPDTDAARSAAFLRDIWGTV